MQRVKFCRTGAPSWALSLFAAILGVFLFVGLATSADAADTVGSDYIIGPGDSFQVFVWHNPDLSATVPVRPDGRISIPLVEDIDCAGKTPTMLAREIEGRLKKFVQDPTVTIIMTNSVGLSSQQIRIVGQAAQPKALPYRANMSVLDAMIAVGGLTPYASGNRAKLIRTQNGRQVALTVRLQDLLEDADMSANTALQPGDIIMIPQSFF